MDISKDSWVRWCRTFLAMLLLAVTQPCSASSRRDETPVLHGEPYNPHRAHEQASMRSQTEFDFARPFFYNHQSLPSGFIYRRRGTSPTTSVQESPLLWTNQHSSNQATVERTPSSRRSDGSPSLGAPHPLSSKSSFFGPPAAFGSSSYLHLHYEQPSFDPATPRNVTGQLGQTVYLHCTVRNLGDKTVSWIRRHDFHVLTVGLATYTTDDRFQAVHNEAAQDWMLQIRLTQLADAGSYECQVNSHPLISLFVNLTVLVPKAHIRGSPDIYVKTGSAINLTCVIRDSPEPPVFIFWYHDERMINYDSSRGDISIQKAGDDTTLSRLFIPRVQPADSGNYTCGPSNAEPTRITVHVINGEKPAAMQHDVSPSGEASSRASSWSWCRVAALQVVLVLWASEAVFRS